jgi:hypothetical protein
MNNKAVPIQIKWSNIHYTITTPPSTFDACKRPENVFLLFVRLCRRVLLALPLVRHSGCKQKCKGDKTPTKKHILTNLSGVVGASNNPVHVLTLFADLFSIGPWIEPGTCLAIMGPSGTIDFTLAQGLRDRADSSFSLPLT